MIEPMLALPLDKVEILNWTDWAIEEKYDGHRLIVQVDERWVKAWTRPRKHAGAAGKAMAERVLPAHLQSAFATLPKGVYDGELLGGDTSTDVTRTDMQAKLRFVIFDLLELNLTHLSTHRVMHLPFSTRRELLEEIFSVKSPAGITLAENRTLTCKDDVAAFVGVIWQRGGEGAMLKRLAAVYQPGKRSKDVIKVKKLQTEVMKVVGWAKGKGEKVDRGPFAMTRVVSQDGKRETSVKTLDDAELAGFAERWMTACGSPGKKYVPHATGGDQAAIHTSHPDIGRLLRIEFQDWTPKGGYRHPRWDRWENE